MGISLVLGKLKSSMECPGAHVAAVFVSSFNVMMQ